MRPNGSENFKRYSSYKSQLKAFKLFLKFLPNGPHKNLFGIFEILKIEILMICFDFLKMGPYGRENFKMLLLLQIGAESFQTFSKFSSQWSSQNYVWDFLKFES